MWIGGAASAGGAQCSKGGSTGRRLHRGRGVEPCRLPGCLCYARARRWGAALQLLEEQEGAEPQSWATSPRSAARPGAHLQAGVHLQEVKVAVPVHQELAGACAPAQGGGRSAGGAEWNLAVAGRMEGVQRPPALLVPGRRRAAQHCRDEGTITSACLKATIPPQLPVLPPACCAALCWPAQACPSPSPSPEE